MTDTLERIKDMERDFRPLHDRMDVDAALVRNRPYHLRKADGEVAKDVVNITVNDPRTFSDRSQAIVASAARQTIVKGKNLTDDEAHIVEDFDRDIVFTIDERLADRGHKDLVSFATEQMMNRGTTAGRYIALEQDEKFSPSFLPVDSRFLVYEHSDRDLEWASFMTRRSRSAVIAQYGEGFVSNAKHFVVRDYWDKEKEEVWLETVQPGAQRNAFHYSFGEGTKIAEKENVLGYVPFVIQGSGVGSMFQDQEGRAFTNESILAPNRHIYPEMSRFASILATQTAMAIEGGMTWESDEGTDAALPENYPGLRSVTAKDKGTKGFEPVRTPDMPQAARLLWAILSGDAQRGGLPNLDFGNLTFPLSAVAIKQLTDTKDQIFVPRISALARFYRSLLRMIIKQYVGGGFEAELGEQGLRRIYKVSDLDKDFSIQYKFFSKDPQDEIANHTIAVQAERFLPDETIVRDILKDENPAETMRLKKIDRDMKVDPVAALRATGHAYIEEGDDLGAQLTLEKIKVALRSQFDPQAVPQPEAKAETPTMPPAAVPLFDGGGRGQPRGSEEAEGAERTVARGDRRADTVRRNQEEG